jgi:anaphase-promoting complex subunit 10
MYFDYLLDESYTPSKIVISAGTGLYDLTEVKTVELREPRGWQTVNVGEFGREYHHPHAHL